MTKKIYQIQIALKGFKPKIWRRILVPSDLTLKDFHKIIQSSMGWENEHLHQFIKNDIFYTVKMPDDDFWNEMRNVDYRRMKISDLLIYEMEAITYEYDFGDGWEHNIILEKILPFEEKGTYPVCIKGQMNCPPEDCGGVWGYAHMLDVLKHPHSEEYEEMIDWLGDEFDPEYFDIDEVNRRLREKDYGCMEL